MIFPQKAHLGGKRIFRMESFSDMGSSEYNTSLKNLVAPQAYFRSCEKYTKERLGGEEVQFSSPPKNCLSFLSHEPPGKSGESGPKGAGDLLVTFQSSEKLPAPEAEHPLKSIGQMTMHQKNRIKQKKRGCQKASSLF